MSRLPLPRVNTVVERHTELALFDRLRKGDAAAFDDVYAEFNTRLFTFLVRLSRRRDVAEDLLEETWLRLVKHAHRLRPDTRLGAWLFTVARNLHVSYTRSRVLEGSAAASLMALWPFNPDHRRRSRRRLPPSSSAESSGPRGDTGGRSRSAAAGGVAGDPSDAADVCDYAEALRQRLHRARETLSKALENDATVETPAAEGVPSCQTP